MEREAHSARVPGHVGEGLQKHKKQSCSKQDQQHNWRHVAPYPVTDGVDGAVPQRHQFCKKPGGKGHKTVAGPAEPYPSLGGKASLTLFSIFQIF